MEYLEYLIDNYWAATIFLLITIVIAGIASLNVKMTFSKYNKVASSRGLPAHVITRQILDSSGLYDVNIIQVRGNLTDHYDPRTNTVALSESVYNSTAVGAIGVAAHECGHAIQFSRRYVPVKIRSALIPPLNIANRVWFFLFLIGMFLEFTGLIYAGIVLFALMVVFQLVTLPVEFDASRRAMQTIHGHKILDPIEQVGARRTLTAAAMTYIAALLVSFAQLIRFLAIARGRRR